jgi:ferric-dicitrate binding protein FerR (iron transport regulator)
MARTRITVTEGVAVVYPDGHGGEPLTLRAGDSTDVDVERLKPEGEMSVDEVIARDKAAPCVGVAHDEPVGERAGKVSVTALDGDIKVRLYEGMLFTELGLAEGDTVEHKITETNRITLAFY